MTGRPTVAPSCCGSRLSPEATATKCAPTTSAHKTTFLILNTNKGLIISEKGGCHLQTLFALIKTPLINDLAIDANHPGCLSKAMDLDIKETNIRSIGVG